MVRATLVSLRCCTTNQGQPLYRFLSHKKWDKKAGRDRFYGYYNKINFLVIPCAHAHKLSKAVRTCLKLKRYLVFHFSVHRSPLVLYEYLPICGKRFRLYYH